VSDEIPEGAEVRSAIIWFEGYAAGSEHYDSAVTAGGFVELGRVWPAAMERRPGQEAFGRRVGIDVERRCFVVEVGPSGRRTLLNIDAAAAVLQLARVATGQTPEA
jgi:hypothetical protein